MSASDPNAWVCLHCGGPVMKRLGIEWIHDRVRARGTPVCPRLPEPVARYQYDAQQTTNTAKQ